MLRIILAGVLGAVIYFLWGMLTWMVIPLHSPTVAGLPNQAAITDALKDQALETGVYVSPWSEDQDDWNDPESEFMQNHQAGPIYSIYYQSEGALPMNARVLGGGFLIDFLAATLAACLLSSAVGAMMSYGRRVGFILGLGIFVALIGHVSYWNWMHFPLDYTLAFVVDVVAGWTLAGLAIAAVIQPREPTQETRRAPERAVTSAARPVQSEEKPARKPVAPSATPDRNDAVTLLATLQREARFIDIVKEPLHEYSDAQVGAAARDVLRDCGVVLDRLFQLQPVVDQQEGEPYEVPAGFDTGRYRVTGSSSGEAPYRGSLVHAGWQAARCALPRWSGSQASVLVIAPAEVEVK